MSNDNFGKDALDKRAGHETKYTDAQKKRAAEFDKKYGYPAPPQPKLTDVRGWLLKLWNWYLRYRGKKKGEVRPYWVRDFNFLELKKQERCNHLKGQVGYRNVLVKDFNVNIHTFIDGKSRIKCLTCGWEVWNLPEFRFKWEQGMRMVGQSTNTPSSSEVLSKVEPNKKFTAQSPVTVAMARKTTYDPDIKGQPDNPIRGIQQPGKEKSA